jgi:hypothetical protein
MAPTMSHDSSGNPDELSSGGSRYHQGYPRLDERQLAILERYWSDMASDMASDAS